MVDRKLSKWQLGILTVLILIIPFILVYQLSKPDITINFDSAETDPFFNKCFLGQSECIYHSFGGTLHTNTELREDDTYWWILGKDVWCVKSQMSFTEPVTNPNVEITQDSEVSCNDLAMFDKEDWDFSTIINGELTYIFTLKGT